MVLLAQLCEGSVGLSQADQGWEILLLVWPWVARWTSLLAVSMGLAVVPGRGLFYVGTESPLLQP